MKQLFKDKKFQAKSLLVIAQANSIIEEYQADGYELTLRQLYYQFVARGLIANSQSEYKKLGSVVNDARLAGMIDWSAIKDRTRAMKEHSHWNSPSSIIETCVRSYRLNTRQDQETYVEVWVEKEALASVIERAAGEHDVPWFACRGYVSQSAMYEAAMRCKQQHSQRVTIIHLGDHDPSGIDMTRDIDDRFNVFGVPMEMKRIALNMDQVDHYNPPPNPTKLTDSRSGPYIREFGYSSWELDALDPKTITDLINTHVNDLTDDSLRANLVEMQEEHRSQLDDVSENWEDVIRYMK
jgi:hypothetical protein